MRDKESNDLNSIYRVPLSRANILSSTLTLYAYPRDWSVEMCGDGSSSYKPNSTGSRYSQRDGA